ncbi:MAG: hypothetical protein HQM06_01900 [Magnetococcales bacterium]|nr:hypothetical protein [Magnetococcales bacterium]
MAESALDEDVLAFIGRRKSDKNADTFIASYHKKFEESGINKGREVLRILHDKLPEFPKLQPCLAYFSIGGSVGSEIETVMNQSSINYGVLLEFDNYACNLARDKARNLASQGKTLEVVTGSVTDVMKDCQNILHKWRKEKKIDGVLVSVQAVIHELPFRAKQFDLLTFLSEMVEGWLDCPFIFICREPIKPFGWPEQVVLNTPRLNTNTLLDFAKDIAAYLSIKGTIRSHSEMGVSMPSLLAVEVLHKLFYIEDYPYEIQEQLTSVEPEEILSMLKKLLVGKREQNRKVTVSQALESSESFNRQYHEYEIEVHTTKLQAVEMPPVAFSRMVVHNIDQTKYQRNKVDTGAGTGRFQEKADEKVTVTAESVVPGEQKKEEQQEKAGAQKEKSGRSNTSEDQSSIHRDSAELFDLLKEKVVIILSGSPDAVSALFKQFLPENTEPPLADSEKILLDILLKSDFSAVSQALIKCHKQFNKGNPSGLSAIVQVSRWLLPWLLLVARCPDEQAREWRNTGKLADVVSIPAGLPCVADMIMAGLDHRELSWSVMDTFPTGSARLDLLPEVGIKDKCEKIIDLIRQDLHYKTKSPVEAIGTDQIDESINVQLEYEFQQGKRYYLILKTMPANSQLQNRDCVSEIQSVFGLLAILKLDNELLVSDQRLFNNIRNLIAEKDN